MIHLITGQPGAGKTLYALSYAQALSEGTREIYYDGIAELRLPWIVLDTPEKWFDLPAGAIVVMDECQRIFRPRGQGAAVPEHVSQLETHRHKGIDLVLITQHPMLVDNNVRRLVGRHFHVVRAFGMQRATVHEWAEVKVECDKRRSDSVRHDFAYPVESFGWYKSAEVHTHKRRLPMRLFVLLFLPVFLIAMVWGVWRWWSSRMEAPELYKLSNQVSVSAGAQGQQAGKGVRTLAQRREDYIKDSVPVIPGLAFTAARYEEVTKPKIAPLPAACVQSVSKGCVCYSQQATKLPDVDQDLCASIVAHGFFVDFDTGQDQDRRSGPQRSAVGGGVVSPVAVVLPPSLPASGAKFEAAVSPAGAAARSALAPTSPVVPANRTSPARSATIRDR